MWGNLECAAPYSRTKTVRLSDCVMMLESTLVHLLTMGCKSLTQALQGLLHAYSKSQKITIFIRQLDNDTQHTELAFTDIR